jgi:hypothetical protein
MDLIRDSLTSQAKRFQLFQPMGGVWATVLSFGFGIAVAGMAVDAMRRIIMSRQTRVFGIFVAPFEVPDA